LKESPESRGQKKEISIYFGAVAISVGERNDGVKERVGGVSPSRGVGSDQDSG